MNNNINTILCSASTMMAISMMGGVFAILPAKEADLFGTKFVGAIHGRMLLFSSAAALAGDEMNISMKQSYNAISCCCCLTQDRIFY